MPEARLFLRKEIASPARLHLKGKPEIRPPLLRKLKGQQLVFFFHSSDHRQTRRDLVLQYNDAILLCLEDAGPNPLEQKDSSFSTPLLDWLALRENGSE